MGIRIMVVDDAAFIRDTVKKQLRDLIPGVEVSEAPDGARALSLIKSQPVDIILSDWEMPNMTGAELLLAVRAMPDAGKLPFIMVSSRGDRSHIMKAIELGVSDYLTKPFTPEELHKKVYKQLKIIGKTPSQSRTVATTQGMAFASVDVLTGGRAAIATAPANKDSSAAAKPAATAKTIRSKAQLRFSNNRTFACVIREMSLQLMHCLMPRAEQLPGLFEQAVVDIETDDDGSLARVNGYVHSIQATENRPDSPSVKLVIRFVDNDAEKFETLSRYIAQL